MAWTFVLNPWKRPWFFLPILLLISLVIQISTLTLSPTVWMDEASILDAGRVAWGGSPLWSVNWNFTQRVPWIEISYLGPLIQELGYALFHSPFGPRLVSVLGGVGAFVFSFLFLKKRIGSIVFAFLLSTAFFLDPIFVQGTRGGRNDGWVFAIFFAALSLLQTGNNTRMGSLVLFLSGALASVALMVWAPAALLIPLLALVWWDQRRQGPGPLLTPYWKGAFYIGSGMTLVLITLSIPNFLTNHLGFNHFLSHSSRDIGTTSQIGETIQKNVLNLLSIFRLSPVFLLALLAFAVHKKRWVFFLPAALILLFMLATRLYEHRYIYLYPYLLVAVALSFPIPVLSESKPKRWFFVLVALAACYGAAISLGARTFLALKQAKERDYNLVVEVAKKTLGPGPHLVIASDWQFYYAGRRLGWHMRGNEEDLVKLPPTELALGNFILISDSKLNADLRHKIATAGFVEFAHPLSFVQTKRPAGVKNFGATLYGPYTFYSNTAMAQLPNQNTGAK